MNAKPSLSPVTIGIDFGGRSLRVATLGEETPGLAPRQVGTRRMRREIRYNGERGSGRILSLKRLLDADETLSLPQGRGAGVGSVEYLKQLFNSIRSDGSLFEDGRLLNTVAAIPPCFSQRQRAVLRSAMENSGFDRVRLVDDTLAAVLASRKRLGVGWVVLVYSWGASTFSAALYRPVGTTFRAVVQEGDRDLGGDDMDAIVLNSCLLRVARDRHCLMEQDGKLLDELEQAKHALLEGGEAEIAAATLLCPTHRTERMPAKIAVDAAAFRERALQMLKRTMDLVEKVLKDGKCQSPDAVLLTGGLTMAPLVRKTLEQRFPNKLINAESEAVACGSVLWGALIPASDWEASGRRAEGERSRKVQAAGSHAEPQPPAQLPAPAGAPQPVSGEPRPMSEPPGSAKPFPAAGSWAANFVPLFNDAERLEREDRLDESLAKLEELNETIGKFFFWVFDKAATTQLARGKKERAYALLQRANRFDPSNERVALKLAEFYAEQAVQHFKGGRMDHAQWFTRAASGVVEALPEAERNYARFLAHYLHIQAEIELHFQRPKEAEAILEKALRLTPQNAAVARRLEEIQPFLKRAAAEVRRVFGPMSGDRRNQRCPCGSGKKYKNCCGRDKT